MARLKEATPILEAAEGWKERCLLDGGSVFTDKQLWTLENLEALDRYYVQNPDLGEDDFFTKLKKQLEPAPAAAKQLAAEMFWVMYLIVHKSAARAETKRFQIKKVWEWSGEPLPAEHPAMGDLLSAGVANTGTGYNTHRWRELVFFVTAMNDWFTIERPAREELLDDPWVFADWLEAREHAAGRQLRHVLLFLLFPDHFERIATTSHKQRVVKQFHAKWGEKAEVDYSDRVALDKAVLAVRERLQSEHADGEVDFYEEQIAKVWREPAERTDGGEPADYRPPPMDESKAWFEKRFGPVRVWMLSAGQGARVWSDFVHEEIAAIGWDALGDLSELTSKEDNLKAHVVQYGGTNPTNNALATWQFGHEISVGDILIAKKGRSKILGWGRVIGDYAYRPERAEYKNTRRVKWERTEPCDIPKHGWITNKTLTDFTSYKDWVWWAFTLMEGEDYPPPPPDQDTYSITEALDGLFLPPEQFSRILDALGHRKNLILQGPPGVGKTFIAKRIAWSLMGRKDPSCLEMVQFHQSYAYEDFVQGWRPTETGGFELRDGLFYKFCERAEANPDRPFVFIIDEINRGNLSRIFGELLMLIEPDKRGPEHAVPLTYSRSGERFSVPTNVHVLGMMNTADRSLAMVDYALRRRFAFFPLKPAFGTEPFQDYLLAADVDDQVVDLIDERMLGLNEKISQDTKNLGPGFEIGHSYFVPSGDEEALDEQWYREIIRNHIEPLLREYWFDDAGKVDGFLEKLLQ